MKVWNYVFISTVLAIIFEMAGIPVASATLSTLGIGLTSSSLGNSLLFLAIFGSAGALIGLGVGVIIGSITRTAPENYIILGVITGTLVGTFPPVLYGIVSYAIANFPGWVSSIVIVLISPLAVGFLIALMEFFRGTD